MNPTRFTHSYLETAEKQSSPLDLHAEPFDFNLDVLADFTLALIVKLGFYSQNLLFFLLVSLIILSCVIIIRN